MTGLYIATAAAVIASLIASPVKTLRAVKMAAVRLAKVLPTFIVMMALFAVAITLIPQEVIRRVLGRESGAWGLPAAAAIGSITLMPGFIAFPLCGALLRQGVTHMVLAGFTTTLMMVGVLTYPLESRYFGAKVTIIRNVAAMVIAMLVAFVIGLVHGELTL